MAEFDPDAYFKNKLGPAVPKTSLIEQGLQEKIADLKLYQRQLAADAPRIAAQEEAARNSLAGRMGLDPTEGLGAVINTAGAAWDTVSRMAGQTAAMIPGMSAAADLSSLSEEEIAAANRYAQGKATDEDLVRLQRKVGPAAARDTPEKKARVQAEADANPHAPTVLELFERANTGREIAREVVDSAQTRLGDEQTRNAMQQELVTGLQGPLDQIGQGGAGNIVEGVAKLLMAAGSAVGNNKQAAVEYAIANAPQLFVGLAGKAGAGVMTAANMGYAADEYNKGIESYRAKNGGALPPEEERQKMAVLAASLALAEQVGDVVSLGLVKPVSKAAKVAKASETKKATLNVVGATGKGFGTEALTEGYQTGAESVIQGEPASVAEVLAGGVIGGVSGGILAGGGRAVAELTKATPEAAAEREARQTRAQQLDAAIVSGDVTPFTTPESSLYSPDKAVQALFGHAQLESTAPEAKEAAFEQASAIITDLDAKAEALSEKVKDKSLPVEERKAAESELKTLTGQFNTAMDVLDKFEAARSKQVDVEQEIEAAKNTAAPAETRLEAVDRVIALAMTAPERVDPKEVEALLSDTTLPEAQRKVLRTFTEARQAENQLRDLGKVSEEILIGSPDNMGIAQYRQRLAQAVAMGNKKLADKQLAGIKTFAQTHRSKAKASAAALRKGLGTQILRSVDGSWEVNTGEPLSAAALKKGRGMSVDSGRLVKNINIEANALDKALAEMEAAYAHKFVPATVNAQAAPASKREPVRRQQPSTTPRGNDDVTQQPQPAGSDRKAKADQPAVQADEAVRSDAAGGQERGVPAAGDPRQVEAAGVEASGAKPTAEVDAAPAEASDGVAAPVLSTLQSNGQTEYKKRNLIADFFTQSAGKEDDKGTKRPLAAVRDFLSAVRAGTVKVTDFLSIKELTDEQKKVITTFSQAAKHFFPTIQANLLRAPNPEFWFRDPVQFLIVEKDGKLDLDENVKTAMAYAVFSWIAEKAMGGMENTDEEINQILGRADDHLVSEDERSKLANVGLRQTVVANALGAKVVQALGLKANRDAPLNLQPTLEAALGEYALKMMLDDDQKLVTRQIISGKEMAELLGKDESETNVNATHRFIRLARDTQGNLNSAAFSIYQASKGTQSVLDKLFGVEPGLREPSLTAPAFEQKKAKNSKQNVPEVLAKIIAEQNKVPNFVRQDMWALVQKLDPKVMLAIAGGVDTENTVLHVVNAKSAEAKNDALRREIQRITDFVSKMKDPEAAIYFEHEVWKQQRVGIHTNAVNPQTSKVHRHMLFRQSWHTTIDMANIDQMNNFRLRVLEGLGVKTDKQSNITSLGQYVEKTSKPEIKAAVDVLVAVMEGKDISAEQQATLAAGVKAGGENMHSLDALMAVAHEQFARKAGKTSFDTQLMGEVDGVTNGPMLTHLLLGAASSAEELFELLHRGGFYEVGSQFQDYNLWRSTPGNLDLYENTALGMDRNANGLIHTGVLSSKGKMLMNPQEVQSTLASIYAFTGPLVENGKVTKDGRNIIKTPLTAMVFGSAVPNAVDSMADKFIEAIYAAIEEAAVKPEIESAVLQELDNLLRMGRGNGLDHNASIEQLMQRELRKDEIKAIKRAFKMTLGKAVEQTMAQDFATFIETRKTLNNTAQLTFQLYDAVYRGLRQQMISELIDGEKIAYRTKKDGTKEPIHDLTVEQEAELQRRIRAMAPVMHTPMSKDSGQLNAGLGMSKSEQKLSTAGNYAYEVEAKFPEKRPYADGSKSTTSRGYQQKDVSPGVAMVVMSTHSADSATSHYAAKGNEVLNVHDAHGAGLGTYEQTARNLNQALWQVMLGYSPATEMANALGRTLEGLAAFLEQGNVPDQVLANLAQVIAEHAAQREIDPDVLLDVVMADARMVAAHADTVKLDTLSKMGWISQYALEGAPYEVTDADRAAAASAKAAVVTEVTDAEKKALDTIAQVLSGVKPAQGDKIVETIDEVRPQPPAVPAVAAPTLIEQAAKLMGPQFVDAFKAAIDAVKDGMPLAEAINRHTENDVLRAHLIQALSRVAKLLPPGLITQWGEIGTSRVSSDPDLVEFFRNNPKAPVARVLEGLKRKISKAPDSPFTAFQKRLLTLLERTVDQNLQVRFVTPTTPDSDVMIGVDAARGWYARRGSSHEVYVLSPEFKHSGLTTETLTHELTHAALANVIDAEQAKKKADPAYTSEALELIEELEQLRTAAEKIIAKMPAKEARDYRPAVKNVHELVSWGMTNLDFQTNVLMKVQMKSKTSGNSLVTGMKQFIDNVVALLFGKHRSEVDTNGMAVLIANVSGLFKYAAETKSVPGGDLSVLAQAAPNVVEFSTLDIHDALADPTRPLSPSFDEHLRGVLTGIVHKIHGAFGSFKNSMMGGQAITPMDVWLKAQQTSRAPFASKVLASPLVVSQQEAYAIEQVEATVQAALNANESRTKISYKQLSELYTEASERIKAEDFHPGDWAVATPAEKATAQAKWDFVFKIESGADGKSDYLARFAALGLAHQEFNTLLQFQTDRDTKKVSDGKTFADKVQILFENILQFFSDKLAHTYIGQPADQKLESLVDQLVDIEARRRNTLQRRFDEGTVLATVEDVTIRAREGAKSVINKVAGSKAVRNSNNAFIKAGGALTRVVINDQVEVFIEGIKRVRDRNWKGRLGFASSLLNELTGPQAKFKFALLEVKNNERERKKRITDASNAALHAFTNQGTTLSETAKAAITSVFMRTGAHHLLGDYTIAEIDEMLANPSKLRAAINKYEAQIAGFKPFHRYFINQANALGYYKATGHVKEPIVMMNSHNMLKLYETPYAGRLSDEQIAQAKPALDALIALYALEYSDSIDLDQAHRVLQAELGRTDGGNGVEFVLKLHKRMEQESLARLFKGKPELMIHGYTPEIYNPNVELKVASSADGRDLKLMGWSEGGAIELDQDDPDRDQRRIYVLKDAGLQPYLTGAMSLTGLDHKGTTKHNGFMALNTVDGLQNAQLQANINNAKARHLRTMFMATTRADLSQKLGTFMAPVFNESGEIVNWRYLMNEHAKDTLLDRDNRFDKVMGVMAGSIFDKQTAPEQNKMVLETLKQDFNENYARSPSSFISVGPESLDPDLREIWKMLPKETKYTVRSTFGVDEIVVRKDSLDLVFGYRKLSLSTIFKKDPDTRGRMEKLITWFPENALYQSARRQGMSRDDASKYAQRAVIKVTKAERVWQELVRETKDLIVVKTGVVLLGNIVSNWWLLVLKGVPMKDIAHHHLVALKGATAYQEDSSELALLQLKLGSGYLSGDEEKAARRQVARLEDAIARNPVKELIDAGLMPTIVEDLAAEDDIYSYKSAFTRWVEEKTSGVNPKVMGVARGVYMTHDTRVYQGLSRITQLSDFVARYTLYQHLISRKNKPLSKDEAILEASDNFVNYDIPMHRMLQYTDDMGLTMFTKYFLRIQRPLLKLTREHPARVLSAMIAGQYVDLGPIVLEGSMVTRIGNNPLETGAFKYIDSLDELMTVNAGMALLPSGK